MYRYEDIRVIHLENTQNCQASCPMCDRNMNGKGINPHIDLSELSVDDCKRIFEPSFIKQLKTMYMCGNLGDPIVVMELIKGETFDLTVERGALTENDFKSFVSQTMEALLAAHEKSIIHRDLKPSNLMVNWLPSGKFQIKILDFGYGFF